MLEYESAFQKHWMTRGRAARKLVGLITRRSLVQIQLPQPIDKRGLLDLFFYDYIYLEAGFEPLICKRLHDVRLVQLPQPFK